MKTALTALIAIALLLYPVVVYWGLLHFEVRYVALLLLALLLIRVISLKKLTTKKVVSIMPVFVTIGLVSVVVVVSNNRTILLLNPVLVNVALLASFGFSLFRGPSMIERFARLQVDELAPAGVRYCRKVTIIWCVFFVLNGTLALWTVLYASLEVWTLYNGLLSYVFIGILFGLEWLYRKLKIEPLISKPNKPAAKDSK